MRTRLFALLPFALLAACSAADATTGSAESAHTEGDFVWNNDQHLWADVDRASFDKEYAAPTVKDGDPLAHRLQQWVDQYDGIVRAVVKEKTGVKMIAPKPRVRLLATKDINAFIGFVPTCLATAPASAAPPAAGAPALEPLVLFDKPSSTRTGMLADHCLTAANFPSDAVSIDWFNKLQGQQLSVSDGAIDITSVIEPNGIHTKQVAVLAAAPFVNVYAELVAELDEKATAVVIAHELGHYYRSHLSTSVNEKYEFWFDRERQIPERPTPVTDQADYRAKYEQLKVPRLTITGQKMHPRLGETMLAWAKDLQVGVGHVCEPVAKAVKALKPGVQSELSYGGNDGGLSSEARQAYLDIDAKMVGCVAGVSLTDAPADLGATYATKDIPRAFFLSRIADPIRSAVQDGDLQATTLADLVTRLTTKAKDLDAQAPDFLKHLADNKIGLYTTEQEADDLAMELSARIGITPDEVLTSFVSLSKALEGSMDPAEFQSMNDGLSSAECESMLQKQFKDGDKDVYVPLGTLWDPHHALCYRVFNLFREKDAHQYKTADATFPEPTPTWAALQQHAKDLISPPPSKPPSGPTDPPGTTGGGDDTTPPATDAPADEGSDDSPSSSDHDPISPHPNKQTHESGGCSAAPSSGAGSGGFVLGLAALLGLSRRRRR